jgi:glucokinase
MPTPPYYVGLDLGGTALKAGVVDDAGRPLAALSRPTEAHRGPDAGLPRMAEAAREAVAAAGLEMGDVAALGVAVPGLMDIPAGVLFEAFNLGPSWRDVPVRRRLAETFGLPTAFQNDANAAAFGEYWAGAARGAKSLVFFTLGTGIGGGIILGDRVVEGAHSHGGELGHMCIELTHPRTCACGRKGCLEAYASATAVVARAREALAADGGRSALHGVLERESTLTSRDIFAAAAAGDTLAGRVTEDTAYYLAVGTTNVMHLFDPEVVVFGGGMTAAGEPLLERVRHHVRRLAFPVPAERTALCYARLGNDAGFIGAAGCARQLVLNKSPGGPTPP